MIFGIDIGASGAVAGITNMGTAYHVWDMPVVDGVASPAGVRDIIVNLGERFPLEHAYVEAAQAMPKQGTRSMFRYGQSFGVVLGVLAALAIPYTLVRPTIWKKAFHLNGKDKEAARALAIQWFPAAPLHLKKHHGRAEALLIARYGSCLK